MPSKLPERQRILSAVRNLHLGIILRTESFARHLVAIIAIKVEKSTLNKSSNQSVISNGPFLSSNGFYAALMVYFLNIFVVLTFLVRINQG